MLGAVQFVHSLDGEQVGGDALYLGTHPVQHPAQLLHVGLAGGVVDGGLSFGEHGCHHDVGGSRYGRLVQQHVAAVQLSGGYLVNLARVVVGEVRSQVLDADEVGIQSPASYLVAARFGNQGFAEACHHRSHQHDGAAQAGTPFQELVAFQVVEIYVCGAEAVGVDAFLRHLDAHVPHQLDEVVHVQDVRDVVYGHLFGSEQCGADDLQYLVLRSLRIDVSGEAVSSFDYE